MEKQYLKAQELQESFGISTKTLANWRSQGKGPAYYKIGGKIRYSIQDIENWMKSNRILTIDCQK